MDIRQQVLKIIKDICQVSDIDPAGNFQVNGIDSLDSMEIIFSVEDELKVTLPKQDWKSIDELIWCVEQLKSMGGLVIPPDSNRSDK
jgi:acyl carrier protein